MDEDTVGSAIPAANVVGLVKRLGLPEDDFPAESNGVFRVSSTLKSEGVDNEFHRVVAYFVREQKRLPENVKIRAIVDAVVLNLTTKNDLKENDLDILSTIVKSGGMIRVSTTGGPEKQATAGMQKAIGRMHTGGSTKGQCTGCGYVIPKYPGKYPKSCPKCEKGLVIGDIEPSMAWHDEPASTNLAKSESFTSLLSALHRLHEGIAVQVVCEGGLTGGVKELYGSLTGPARNDFHRAVSRVFGTGTTQTEDTLTPADVTSLRRSVYFLDEQEKCLWQPLFREFCVDFALGEKAFGTVFSALVEHLDSGPPVSMDPVLSKMFCVFSVKSGMTERLRDEVAKRSNLTEAIRTCSTPNKFTLVKALSSCLTRTMIEGETKGGEEHSVVGATLFHMMERAFSGDMVIPSRFMSLYFLRG